MSFRIVMGKITTIGWNLENYSIASAWLKGNPRNVWYVLTTNDTTEEITIQSIMLLAWNKSSIVECSTPFPAMVQRTYEKSGERKKLIPPGARIIAAYNVNCDTFLNGNRRQIPHANGNCLPGQLDNICIRFKW